MKKECKWPIWIGCFVLLAVLALSVFVLLSGRSRSPAFDPSPLIGLTKEEVLELAFDQYTKYGDELTICVRRINQYGNPSLHNLYYKTLEDAKNDASLMSSDVWETNEHVTFNCFIFKKQETFVFHFDDGKVVKVRKNSYGPWDR